MTGFIDGLRYRIYMTFVYQDRWKFLWDGLWMTIFLAMGSFLIGSVIGAILCAMRFCKKKWVQKTSVFISKLIVQLPTLVILMFFIYLVFAYSGIAISIIAMFAMAFKAGAYLSDIFYVAIESVDSGEREAARSLGLTKVQTFRYVTLPQAVGTSLTLYKNEFIVALQETSIVGYVAIVDLTQASNIITSRTLDAFFSLIVISVLYLFIGWAVGRILDWSIGNRKSF